MSSRYKIEYRLYKDMNAANPRVYTLWDGNYQHINDAVVKTEINRVSTFDFTIYPSHVHYEKMVPRLGFCTVWDMSKPVPTILFNGQIRGTTTDLYGEKTVHCESDLGLLNDWRVKHAALNQSTTYPGLSGSVALSLIFGSTESIPSLVAPATLKLVEDGSTIIPVLGTTTFPSVVTIEYNNYSVKTPNVAPGIEPIEFHAGTALDALNTFLRAWPGRIDITYPVDLWHPVFNYTHENCIVKHVCSQSIAVGSNVLSLDRDITPDEPIVTSLVPSYTAVYKSDSLARKAGKAPGWNTAGNSWASSDLLSIFGSRNGSPKKINIEIEYDSFHDYVESLGAYFVADRVPTVDSSWYAVGDTELSNPIPFSTIVQLYSDAILEDWIDGAVDEGGYSDRTEYFEAMFSIEDGLVYDIKVVDLSLVDASIESFELGDYAAYDSDHLLITAKTMNLFHPEDNTVDLNNRPDSLTEYLSKAR